MLESTFDPRIIYLFFIAVGFVSLLWAVIEFHLAKNPPSIEKLLVSKPYEPIPGVRYTPGWYLKDPLPRNVKLKQKKVTQPRLVYNNTIRINPSINNMIRLHEELKANRDLKYHYIGDRQDNQNLKNGWKAHSTQ